MDDGAKLFAAANLDGFKEKMRITHNEEDEYLLRLLTSSTTAIAVLVGASQYDDSIVELVSERAMYVYSDALDEFKQAYAGEIEDLYLRNMLLASEVEEDVAQ